MGMLTFAHTHTRFEQALAQLGKLGKLCDLLGLASNRGTNVDRRRTTTTTTTAAAPVDEYEQRPCSRLTASLSTSALEQRLPTTMCSTMRPSALCAGGGGDVDDADMARRVQQRIDRVANEIE